MDLKQVDDDLVIDATTGDFSTEESDEQNIEDIILADPGSYKEYPLVGVGISNYLNASTNPQEIERLIKIQLKADGYKVGNPKVNFESSSKLLIQPNSTR